MPIDREHSGPNSRIDTLRTLISQPRVDLNALSHNGTTALIAAARLGMQGMAQELLIAGANAALTDHSGRTAYDHAVAGGHDYCASYIANFDIGETSRLAPLLVVDVYAVLGALVFCAVVIMVRGGCAARLQQRLARLDQPKRARPKRRRKAEALTEPEWWVALDEYHDALEEKASAERKNFFCKISQEIMRHPALLADGRISSFNYEHDHVKRWIDENGSEPTTRDRMRNPRITLNGELQREIRQWCEQTVEALQVEFASSANSGYVLQSSKIVHVLVDHSNIAIGALKATGKQLDIGRLVRCVEGRRDVRERKIVGSLESERTKVAWQKLGYTVTADKRPGKEHLVDDTLHAQILETAGKIFNPRRVLVLVTGDGNNNKERTTFPKCVDSALKNDWRVEVYSWRQRLHHMYNDLAEHYPEHVSVHILDNVY